MNKAVQSPAYDRYPGISENHLRRAKRRQQGSVTRGKVLIVVIFCVLRGLDALMYLGTPSADKKRLLGMIIIFGAWSTVLLAGLWKRQEWARYLLIGLLLAGNFAYLFLAPDVSETTGTTSSLMTIFLASSAVHAAIIWSLLQSRHIRRLVQR